MTDVQSTKKRAKSVANIGRITKSLEMVSAISVKQAEKRLGHRQPFITELTALLNTLPLETDKPLPFLGSQTGKTLLIVITSNRGLVGGLYQDLFRKVREEFINKEGVEVELMLFGEKGYALKDLGVLTGHMKLSSPAAVKERCSWIKNNIARCVCFSEFVSLTQICTNSTSPVKCQDGFPVRTK
jgi:ATP synthase F1 gamma subunit